MQVSVKVGLHISELSHASQHISIRMHVRVVSKRPTVQHVGATSISDNAPGHSQSAPFDLRSFEDVVIIPTIASSVAGT
jgi:hypothetical protein